MGAHVSDPCCPPPGYVQGMSDLLSPVLYVTQNEVDAFWCFSGFMDLVVRGLQTCWGGAQVVAAVWLGVSYSMALTGI